MKNPLKLHSKRLSLSLVEKSDLKDIHHILSLPIIDKYNTQGVPATEEETWTIIKPWIEENEKKPIQNYSFKIIHKEKFLGLVGFKLSRPKYKSAEIWYKILPEYWNQGLTTEAVNLIIEWGFETLNLHRIEAGCATENLASIRVMEKVGMQKEGMSRKVLPLKSGWANCYSYAILKEEWRSDSN